MATERDDDAELRRMLRSVDPARASGPIAADRAERLRERIMLSPQDRAPAARRRGWLVGGFSAVGAGAAAAVAVPIVVATGAAGVTALQAPQGGGPAAICAEVTPEALASVDLAFRGQVEAIDGTTVTLRVTERFTGDVTDTVTVPQGADNAIDGEAPVFVDGGSYLVAARDGLVLGCGLTGVDGAALETIYEQAF